MTRLIRYDMYGYDFDTEVSEDGDWVRYDDWERMQGEFITLLVKYNNLVEKLGDVYKGA